MRVLIIDSDRVGLDFAMRASACGHEVKLFRYSLKPSRYATGFAPMFTLVDDWRQHMAWARDGLILLTANNKYVHELERYKEFGYRNIFAPSVASARLEIERSAGMQIMQSIGAELPAYETFDSLADAEAFARKSDRAWCFKPTGDNEDKSLTYVAKDPADLVGWLQRQMKKGKKITGKGMLQEKVDRLIEVGISGWMGPEGFLEDKYQLCFEHKPLMSGDIGPATGEMGTITQYVADDRLAREFLLPLEPALRALGHRGDTALNFMIDKKGRALFLEFTCRLGWPCFWLQCASHRGDPVTWMADLLAGRDSLKVSYDAGAVVVMTRPDFPYDDRPPSDAEGIPIRNAETVLADLHLVEAMLGTGPQMKNGKVVDGPAYLTAGTYVAVATAMGKTVTKARDKVYKVVDQVGWPDRLFRDDIGEKVVKNLPALHRFGYAKDVTP